jgi:hypothetical protein
VEPAARGTRAEGGDAIVVVWLRPTTPTAAREVIARPQALDGLAETRQAPDGTTGFERILPGPDRMYPDTDTPPCPSGRLGGRDPWPSGRGGGALPGFGLAGGCRPPGRRPGRAVRRGRAAGGLRAARPPLEKCVPPAPHPDPPERPCRPVRASGRDRPVLGVRGPAGGHPRPANPSPSFWLLTPATDAEVARLLAVCDAARAPRSPAGGACAGPWAGHAGMRGWSSRRCWPPAPALRPHERPDRTGLPRADPVGAEAFWPRSGQVRPARGACSRADLPLGDLDRPTRAKLVSGYNIGCAPHHRCGISATARRSTRSEREFRSTRASCGSSCSHWRHHRLAPD